MDYIEVTDEMVSVYKSAGNEAANKFHDSDFLSRKAILREQGPSYKTKAGLSAAIAVSPLYKRVQGLEAELAKRQWRSDMENAPRDGTRILLRTVIFNWNSNICQHVAVGHKAEEGFWGVTMSGKEDWRTWCGSLKTHSTNTPVPIAWMPLPEPPNMGETK